MKRKDEEELSAILVGRSSRALTRRHGHQRFKPFERVGIARPILLEGLLLLLLQLHLLLMHLLLLVVVRMWLLLLLLLLSMFLRFPCRKSGKAGEVGMHHSLNKLVPRVLR